MADKINAAVVAALRTMEKPSPGDYVVAYNDTFDCVFVIGTLRKRVMTETQSGITDEWTVKSVRSDSVFVYQHAYKYEGPIPPEYKDASETSND